MQNLTKAIILFVAMTVTFASLILFVWFFLTPYIITDVATSPTNDNGTAVVSITAQSVPTVVNGVLTATSVIVGFTATLVGIVSSQLLKDDKRDNKMREYLIGVVLFQIISILLLDFGAYTYLILGGIGFVVALQIVLVSFVLGLLLLAGIFVIIWLIIEEHKTKPATPNPPQAMQCKITLKNGDKVVDAMGMDGDTVQRVLESWNKNINPANSEKTKSSMAKKEANK